MEEKICITESKAKIQKIYEIAEKEGITPEQIIRALLSHFLWAYETQKPLKNAKYILQLAKNVPGKEP